MRSTYENRKDSKAQFDKKKEKKEYLPTWRSYHPLPLLKKTGLETVPGAQAVRLMPGHEFLHWLQDHT